MYYINHVLYEICPPLEPIHKQLKYTEHDLSLVSQTAQVHKIHPEQHFMD